MQRCMFPHNPDYSSLPDGARWLLDPSTMIIEKSEEAIVGLIYGEEAKEQLKEARKTERLRLPPI